MKPLATILAAATLTLLPEVLRIVNDERARRHQAREEEKKRAHDAEQKRLDRESAERIAGKS